MNDVNKPFMSRNTVTLLVSACIGMATLIVFVAHSTQVGRIQGYTLNEPLSIAPTYEAAARKELFVRLAQHYAAGVSPNNAYYLSLLDSFYIRMLSFITGHEPVISDPAFVDPLLQWGLVVKSGLFCIFLILVIFLILNKTYGNPFLLGIFILLFVGSSEVSTRGFEVKENLDMGVGILLVFSYFLYAQKHCLKASITTGIWVAVIGLIKTPVMLLTPILISSVRSGIAYGITIALTRNKKAPPSGGAGCSFVSGRSDQLYAGGLGTFGPFGNLELNGLAFVQRLEAFAFNVAVMNEDVRAVVGRDESVTLGVVEPLHFTGSHNKAP